MHGEIVWLCHYRKRRLTYMTLVTTEVMTHTMKNMRENTGKKAKERNNRDKWNSDSCQEEHHVQILP